MDTILRLSVKFQNDILLKAAEIWLSNEKGWNSEQRIQILQWADGYAMNGLYESMLRRLTQQEVKTVIESKKIDNFHQENLEKLLDRASAFLKCLFVFRLNRAQFFGIFAIKKCELENDF